MHKDKVYVLRLKVTHTALVNTYIWTIRNFDCEDELERDWKRKFLKMERQFSVGPDRLVKEDHIWRWTTLTGTFPLGPNRSIYVWTEISGNCGIMESPLDQVRCVARDTLGARDFSRAVSGFCQVFIVTRAVCQHRKFPPHARKTSSTQGKHVIESLQKEEKSLMFSGKEVDFARRVCSTNIITSTVLH